MQHPDVGRIENFLHNFKNDASITSTDRECIEEFYNYSVERGLGYAGRAINLMEAIYWARLIPNFKTATKNDVRKAVSVLMDRKDYAGYTKIKKLSVLRSMYKHLFGQDEYYPETVSWISKKGIKIKEKKMDDMITREDLSLLIKACKNSQEAALLYFLWETGMRAGELLSVKIKGIKDAGTHYTVEVDGKTGMRNIAFIEAIPYLKMWLNEHPDKNSGDAPLFCVDYFKKAGISPFTIRHLNLILKKIAIRINFKKPVNPHNFRHSSATEKAPKLPQAVLCNYYGWTQGSKMPGTYLHVSNEQTNNEVLKLYGINPNTKPEAIETIKCSVCGQENPPGHVACSKCGRFFEPSKVINMNKTVEDMQRQIQTLSAVMGPLKGKKGETKLRDAMRQARAREWLKKMTPEKVKEWGSRWKAKNG